jgi:hypothetical protein
MTKKRHWNYRIIDFGTHKALHEVHYQGGRPVAYGSEPADFVCDPDQDDIANALERALGDVKHLPALAVGEIGGASE